MAIPSADEGELLERMRQGDQTALAELFEMNRDRLLRMIAIRIDPRLQGRVDEVDVLQEAFLSLSQSIHRFAQYPDMSAYVWMRLAVQDRLIALHRRHIQAGKRDARREVSLSQKANSEDSSLEIADQLEDSFSSVGGKVARQEVARIVQATLQKMDDKDREIILMRIFERMSNAEAAQALGLSNNGASSRFSRAMDRLQQEVLGSGSQEA